MTDCSLLIPAIALFQPPTVSAATQPPTESAATSPPTESAATQPPTESASTQPPTAILTISPTSSLVRRPTDFRQRLPEGWKSTVRLLDQAWTRPVRFGSGEGQGERRPHHQPGQLVASPEAGARGEIQPGHILRSAPLLVDAEEDVADEADVPQLRHQRGAPVQGAVQKGAQCRRRH